MSNILVRRSSSQPRFPSCPAVREYARIGGHVHEALDLFVYVFARLSSLCSRTVVVTNDKPLKSFPVRGLTMLWLALLDANEGWISER